jgi:tetratricopeptide (TPR) repeat protein
MLKDLLQSKESRNQEKVEKHLEAGILQLKQKMYNGAMVEFGKAMDLDFENVYPRLLKELESAAAGGEMEAALAVGLNMLKYKKDNHELANKLGNFARKNNDIKQAKALYQTALKINKKYTLAFYNLAAVEAKTEFYDDQAVSAVSQFKDIKGYILPGYYNASDPVESLTEQAKSSKLDQAKKKIRAIMAQRNKAQEDGNTTLVQSFEIKIEKLKKGATKITIDDICNEFNKLIAEEKEGYQHSYNLAIYALSNGKPEIGIEAINNFDEKEVPTRGLLLAIATDLKGERQEAIDKIVHYLGENELNRYYNVNLGLIYRKSKNSFLATKYLLKTAELLRHSDGLYNMHELLKEADQQYVNGNLKKALKFYRIASSEVLEPLLYIKMGSIYQEQSMIPEAIEAYQGALRIDPGSKKALADLQSIHDKFVLDGDKLMEEKKYNPAVEQYEKALDLFRLPETLKKAAKAYRQLNSIKKSNELLEECERQINAEKDKEQEKLRTALVIKAKMMIKNQKYQAAIEILEAAFKMKLDKNVYAQLATLVKRFKGQDSLAGLEKRWNDMLIAEERKEAERKEKELKLLEEEKALEQEK